MISRLHKSFDATELKTEIIKAISNDELRLEAIKSRISNKFTQYFIKETVEEMIKEGILEVKQKNRERKYYVKERDIA